MTRKRSDISVLMATPHVMVRELLMGALKRHRQFHVVESATTAHEVLEAVQSKDIDVALITPSLADGPLSGLGALRQIRECFPEVKTVVLLNGPERNLVVDVFRAGAKGVFELSASSFRSLCRCVEQVHAGQIWANGGELSEVMEAFSQLAPMRVVNADGMCLLTKREEDVVRLLVEGMQNRDIARELKLSEHTVKNYLFHIFDKLGVSSRVELVMYAVTCTNRMQTADSQRSKHEIDPTGGLEVTCRLLMSSGQDSGVKSSQERMRKPNARGRMEESADTLELAAEETELARKSA
jgi:DNA-binding NarL/FixJ family response regulator